MTAVRDFLTRTHGRGRLSWVDWVTYAYLIFGFLIIFLPVSWIALNSVKSSFQLEKQDLALLPSDFVRVARATVYGPDGREIFIMPDQPDWVLNWDDLSAEERAAQDVEGYLATLTGRGFYAMRSHLGQVPALVRDVIARENLPDWLLRYPSMNAAARAERDVAGVLAPLDPEDRRLLSEFLGIDPFEPNRLVTQILVTAPDPETGEMTEWAAPSFDPNREIFPARRVDNSSDEVVRVPTEGASAERVVDASWGNYFEPLTGRAFGVNVDFASCFTNSVLVTVIATLLTLLINSMAAFALSKYVFRGQAFFFIAILATLMVPPTITLVGVFKAINATGLSGSIWGVIIPGAATPAGVFLLRQYMLTIPDELIEAARMDAASEWKIYWRIILPLALPALAALGILSVIWRWNDLILPMVAIATTKEAYTIQLCLLEFRGEHLSQEHYRLAMTVVSLIPTTLVFVFLQKYITTGIANTGGK
ncbi:carbohydrate ABC transporter permease [Sulfitobacter sp. S190]|uniref:carbohydrate ABC transporter permease n=1 Tax=Sulfitobacter sp. S190 TaxID=2867022 RepID=UPI0021A3AD9F|nr:carbohydrate ABC transporter permease [Sulfitobacter sp. S190]UWR21878.1 carbohydrate ABC transporter permease [Sulfitobacter sp. S190]